MFSKTLVNFTPSAALMFGVVCGACIPLVTYKYYDIPVTYKNTTKTETIKETPISPVIAEEKVVDNTPTPTKLPIVKFNAYPAKKYTGKINYHAEIKYHSPKPNYAGYLYIHSSNCEEGICSSNILYNLKTGEKIGGIKVSNTEQITPSTYSVRFSHTATSNLLKVNFYNGKECTEKYFVFNDNKFNDLFNSYRECSN